MFPITDSERRIEEHQQRYWQRWHSQEPAQLFHYTSLSAAARILESKCFWATDIRCMNDPTEQHYAWDLTLDVLSTRSDGISRELAHILTRAGGIPGLEDEVFRYSVSFCSERDVASQWCNYASSEGVALTVPFSVLRRKAWSAELALIRLVYDIDCQVFAMRNFMDHVLDCWSAFGPECVADQNQFLGYVGFHLIQLMFRFKNPAYWREHEWRVLLVANKEEHPTVLRHRFSGADKVPYIEFPFAPEDIAELIVGPAPYGPSEVSVREALRGCANQGLNVSQSTVSLFGRH